MFIEWGDKYKIGIESIDIQHKDLVDIINLLHDQMGQGNANSMMEPIFDELIAYIKKHFKYEEYLFIQHDYPNKLEHLSEHQLFVAEISELHLRFLNGDKVAIEITRFLRDWLLNHILVSDKEYVHHLLEKGVK